MILLLALPAAAPLGAQGSYGFVARLGRDTVFIERVVRTPTRLSGDVLELNPIVTIRHYDAVLAPDGSVTRFVISSRAVNADATAGEREKLLFDGDTLRVAIGPDDEQEKSATSTRGVLTMPWFRSSYATSEQLLLAAARRGGNGTTVMTYTTAGSLPGIASTTVRRFGRDSASLDYRGMPIVARFDASGRIVSFSGDRTTNKLDVTRVEDPPDIAALAARFARAERALGGRPVALSPRDTARGTIGAASLVVEYGSPRLRGRVAIGRLVPVDSVWRTGADQATELDVSAPVRIAGISLAAGRYTLWTMLTTHGPSLIINRVTGQWGTDYDPARDVARAPLRHTALSLPVEAFTIRVEPTGRSTGVLVLEWDHFRWTGAIVAE